MLKDPAKQKQGIPHAYFVFIALKQILLRLNTMGIPIVHNWWYQSANIIIVINNFCIALFSGVPKLTALYNILQHFLSFTNIIYIIMTTNTNIKQVAVDMYKSIRRLGGRNAFLG